jgi:hypothetical protein
MERLLGAVNLHGLDGVRVVASDLLRKRVPLRFSPSASPTPRLFRSSIAVGYGDADLGQDFFELLALDPRFV